MMNRKPPLPIRRGRRSSALLLSIPKAMDQLISRSPSNRPLFKTKRSKSVSDGLDSTDSLQFREILGLSEPKKFEVEIVLPDGRKRMVAGMSGMVVKDLVNDIVLEYNLSQYHVCSVAPYQVLNLEADVALIRGENLVIYDLSEDNWDPGISLDDNPRLRIVVLFHKSERAFVENIRSISEVYAEPLRKFTSMASDDHHSLFSGLGPILSLATLVCLRLEDAIDSWDCTVTRIGNFFTKHFWNQYDDYYAAYKSIRQLLRKKRDSDTEFTEFCKMRRGAARQSLESLLLLPVQRVPEYDKYLHDLLNETEQSHPDYADLSKAASSVSQMVKEREHEMNVAENDHKVESVQDRFPSDDLELQDKISPKIHTLYQRRRSAPSAVLLKTLNLNKSKSSSPSSSVKSNPFLADILKAKQSSLSSRLYLLEGPVQLVSGVQSRDRYLFLFNDILLIAKQRSPTSPSFRLKYRIRICELWLSDCLDDVSDIPRPAERSFVMGWPTMNVVATFNSSEEKDLWWNKISKQIAAEKMREEPKSISLKMINRDLDDFPATKVIAISNEDDANDCVRMYFEHYDSPELDPKDFQILVISGKEGGPYPLVGHEKPYSIKMNHVRDVMKAKRDDFVLPGDTDMGSTTVPSEYQCQFIIKRKGKATKPVFLGLDDSLNHKKLRKLIQKKSPIITFFRKNKSSPTSSPTQGKLFGVELSDILIDDQLPKAIMDLFRHLYDNGPFVKGILRVSANSKLCKELKDALNCGLEVQLDDKHTLVTGSVLKDFFRSLPDAIMGSDLYDKWVATNDIEELEEHLSQIISLFQGLTKHSQTMLRHLFCILYYIAEKADDNNMNAYNLGVCISQSLLWPPLSAGLPAQADASKKVPIVIEFLIDNCVKVFGEDILTLFGEPPQQKQRHDSGTDSDSMHSILSTHELTGGNHDDSSMDSLDRELYEIDASPKLAKSHLSPSNLSRDSGLTLSDSQLYLEEGIDYEASSVIKAGDTVDFDALSRCAETYPPVPPPRKSRHRSLERNLDSSVAFDQRRFARLCAMPGNGTLVSSMCMEKGRAVLGGSPASEVHRSRVNPLSKRISNDSLQSVEENEIVFHEKRRQHIDEKCSGHNIYSDEESLHTGDMSHGSSELRHLYGSQDSLDYLDRNIKFSLEYSSQDSEPSTPVSPQLQKKEWPLQSFSSSFTESQTTVKPLVNFSSSYSGSSNIKQNSKHLDKRSGISSDPILILSKSAPCTPDNISPGESLHLLRAGESKTPRISPKPVHRPILDTPPPLPPKPAALRVKGAGKITSPTVDKCQKGEALKVYGSPPPEVILRRGKVARNKVYEFSPEQSSPSASRSADLEASIKRPHKPPTYKEALHRKSLLIKGLTEFHSDIEILKQTKNSAHARKLYEDSVNIYVREHSFDNNQDSDLKQFCGSDDSLNSDEGNSLISNVPSSDKKQSAHIKVSRANLEDVSSQNELILDKSGPINIVKCSTGLHRSACDNCKNDKECSETRNSLDNSNVDCRVALCRRHSADASSVKSDSSNSSKSSADQVRPRRPPPNYRPPPPPVSESPHETSKKRKDSGVQPPGDFSTVTYTEESYV